MHECGARTHAFHRDMAEDLFNCYNAVSKENKDQACEIERQAAVISQLRTLLEATKQNNKDQAVEIERQAVEIKQLRTLLDASKHECSHLLQENEKLDKKNLCGEMSFAILNGLV